jgi:hypothetical protein
MSNLKITVDANILKRKLEKLEKSLENLPQETLVEFKKNTPIKSGNAKRNTKLKGSKISADYPYATVLDKGRHMTRRGMRGSEQAPEGMSKPTIRFLEKRVKQIIRGL